MAFMIGNFKDFWIEGARGDRCMDIHGPDFITKNSVFLSFESRFFTPVFYTT